MLILAGIYYGEWQNMLILAGIYFGEFPHNSPNVIPTKICPIKLVQME